MYGGVRNLYRDDIEPRPVANAPKRLRPPSSFFRHASIARAISSGGHGCSTVGIFFLRRRRRFLALPSRVSPLRARVASTSSSRETRSGTSSSLCAIYFGSGTFL